MSEQEKKDDNKVINLAAVRESKTQLSEPEVESYFEMVEKINKNKEERLKKERKRDNKGVLRSYRIKH